MAEYDISHMGIIVILDYDYHGGPGPKQPVDVEGTVLKIYTHHKEATDMYKAGRVVELLCDSAFENEWADAYVRWENDDKEWTAGGGLLLRRAKVSYCDSIWNSKYTGVKLDTRPYHALCPSFWQRVPSIRYTKATTTYTNAYAPTVYPEPTLIPEDGQWHKCIHQGVGSIARKEGPGIQIQEETVEGLRHMIPNPYYPVETEDLVVGGTGGVSTAQALWSDVPDEPSLVDIPDIPPPVPPPAPPVPQPGQTVQYSQTINNDGNTVITTTYADGNQVNTTLDNTTTVEVGEPVQFDQVVIQNNGPNYNDDF